MLEKFKKALKECRKNGFINPHISGEKLVWYRIMGNKRNKASDDPCTLCDNTEQSGMCRGGVKPNIKGEKVFKPCWEMSKEAPF